eukprot:4575292-Prymnesium_polylepis.1
MFCSLAILLAIGDVSASKLYVLPSVSNMQQLVNDNSRAILFVKNGDCKACDAFEPALAAIAKLLKDLPIGTIDGSIEGGKAAKSFG